MSDLNFKIPSIPIDFIWFLKNFSICLIILYKYVSIFYTGASVVLTEDFPPELRKDWFHNLDDSGDIVYQSITQSTWTTKTKTGTAIGKKTERPYNFRRHGNRVK